MLIRVLRITAVVASLATALAGGRPAFAVTSEQAGPIKVNRCDPQHRKGSPAAYVGYRPAYYPPGRYYWGDVYGYRYYQPPVSASAILALDYVNETQNEMSRIDFGLVARGHLVAEVRDVGKFSPGVEIKHEFGLSPNVFPLGTGLPACVPLRVTYADGTHWKNPHLPALQKSIYTASPQ